MTSPEVSSTSKTSSDKVVSDGRVEKEPHINLNKIKRTNRVIRSCSRCKKRKVKCNFEIPCDRCIARNQAHLCTRDPVIFDGMLIANDDQQELKFSQENEVLKKKIKELQNTIVKLKSINKDQPAVSQTIRNNISNNIIDASIRMNVPSYNKLKLNEVILTNQKKKGKNKKEMDPESKAQTDWKTYSSTVSILEKALTNGMILDNSNSSATEMEYNTEEWLVLNDKSYLQYQGEDPKSKCWMYELDLINKLDKRICDMLVNAGLRITILFPIVDPTQFLEDYEKYWANPEIPEKHLTTFYTKSAESYSFLGLMYSLMCFGLYQCDADDIKVLKFTHYDWDNYSRGLFSAALESLFRARYMTYPDTSTIQIISMIRILSGFLGGINISSCLTGTSFFISYKLDLINTTDFIKLNNMWITLCYDWYDDWDRYSLTTLAYTDSLKKLERFIEPDEDDDEDEEPLINWSQYLLMRLVEVSIIKKKYYFGGVDLSLKNLKAADVELSCLKVETHRDFDSYTTEKYPDIPPEMLDCIRFHFDALVNNETLEVNLKMSTFMTYNEWSSFCYPVCESCATEILEQFISKDIPLIFKSYPYIFWHVVYATVFLIVDCMLDENHAMNQKRIIKLTSKIIPILKSFKALIRGAVRCVYVTEKLLFLMKLKRSDTKGKKKKTSHLKKRQQADPLEDIPEGYVADLKSPVDARQDTQGIPTDTSVTTKGDTTEDGESHDEDEDNDDDDVPLYYSTLSKQDNTKFLRMLAQQNTLQQTPGETIQPILSENVSQTPDIPLNEIPNMEEPSTPSVDLNNVSFQSLLSPGNINFAQLPIQNTIMDILEDGGWLQFINSIDDLNT